MAEATKAAELSERPDVDQTTDPTSNVMKTETAPAEVAELAQKSNIVDGPDSTISAAAAPSAETFENRMSCLGGGSRGRHFDLKEYLPLVKSNTAYVVKRDVEGDEKVLREVMQVLNKLTDKNAEKLTDQILKMHITNEELLKQIVKAVFEKAVNEPHFSPVYASLCERLQGLSVHSATQQPKTAAEMMQSKQDKEKADKPFRRLMLLACQEKFSEYKFPTKEETEAAANDADATAKLLLSRRRFLNLMRFVGELFLCRNVLAANVVRICITTLFTTATSLGVPQAGETNWQPAEDQMIIEDAMEGLCCFLTTTGRLYTEVKNPQWQADFNAVIARLKAIATIRDTDRLSSRIRFAIVDVVMLARNNWVPRVSGAAVSAHAPKKMKRSGAHSGGFAALCSDVYIKQLKA